MVTVYDIITKKQTIKPPAALMYDLYVPNFTLPTTISSRSVNFPVKCASIMSGYYKNVSC